MRRQAREPDSYLFFLTSLDNRFVWGYHPTIRDALDHGYQVRVVGVVNCDEGAIVGADQLEYVGACGKHFPGNLNGFVDGYNRFLIGFVGSALWDEENAS